MTRVEQGAPLGRFIDLSTLSQAGDELTIDAKADELKQLAKWIDVDVIERFEAVVRLKKLSKTRFTYFGAFKTDLVQACVVTLEPVVSHIEREFTRELHLASGKPMRKLIIPAGGDPDGLLNVGMEEAPEEIDNPRYDVVAPLLEELVLAIDPYPRREGVEFSDPELPGEKPETPFAILKKLANQD